MLFRSYRYVLNDGRLLYVDYNEQAFATGIDVVNENGETTDPLLQPMEPYHSENMDDFKKYLVEKYKGTETKMVVPKLVSDEFKLREASDYKDSIIFRFIPKDCDENSEDVFAKVFGIKVYKIDLMYEDLVNFYKLKERIEVIECKDGVVFIKKWGLFIFNNNGRAVEVSIPDLMREDRLDEDLFDAPITSLEDLNKYITIEYFYLSDEN